MIHVISPHVDDAVLSIGGLISILLENKQEVIVHYIFSISNWTNSASIANRGKIKKKTAYVTSLRKDEEKNVSNQLGHRYEFMDLIDFPLRNTNDKKSETFLTNKIVLALSEKINKNETCIFPIGHKHPDHKLVGLAAKMFIALGYKVHFYEDLPYAFRHQQDHETTLDSMMQLGYDSDYFQIDIKKKLSLLKLYESQMSDEWLDIIKCYSYNLMDNKFYERVWRPKISNFKRYV